MNFFNNTLLFAMLLSTGFIDAARVTGGPAPQTPTTAEQIPVVPRKTSASRQTPTKRAAARPTARGRSRTRPTTRGRSRARQPRPTQQPAPQTPPVTQKPQVPSVGQQQLVTAPNCIVNSVIMILDPHRSERVELAIPQGLRSMACNALRVLQEKSVPVIMTSNLLEILITVRQRMGDSNVQQLRNLIQTTTDENALSTLDEQLWKSLNINVQKNILPFISLMDFDNQNVNCYFHKSADLVLIIPKQHIKTNLPNAEKLNLDDQARACGFNPTVVTATTDLTTDNLLRALKSQQATQVSEELFVNSLISLFIPQKQNGELISPEQDIKWALYMVGHGSPAHQTIGTIRDQLEIHKGNLAVLQSGKAKRGRGYPDKATTQATVKKYEKMLEGKSNWPNSQLIPESAQIAGLNAGEFSRLITFFDKSLDTAYLHYTTCFAGGYNQSFINEVLSSLDVKFIVSAEGIHEGVTMSVFVSFTPNSSKTGLVPMTQPYTDFFKLLRLFICQPGEFVKIKGGKKDPIAQLLKTVVPNMIVENQPFVRFPGTGVFAGLSLDKTTQHDNTKVLTQTMVRAHEIEKKPINIGADINILIINPSRINVPLNLGKNGHCAIVSPSPENTSPSYEAIHVFKEMNCEQMIQPLLYNFIYLNARFHKQTFIITELTNSLYLSSGLPYAKENVIHNLIIQIKGISGSGSKGATNTPSAQSTPVTAENLPYGDVGANVQVIFEFDGNVYQCTIGIKDFSSNDLRSNIEKITFTSQSAATIDMNSVANKFLTPKEMEKLTKPITLNSIAQFIDAKIDQQPFSAKLSDEDEANKALLEFTKRKQQ